MSEPRDSFNRYWQEGTAHSWVNIFAEWMREDGESEKSIDRWKYVLAFITSPLGLLIGLVRWFVVK